MKMCPKHEEAIGLALALRGIHSNHLKRQAAEADCHQLIFVQTSESFPDVALACSEAKEGTPEGCLLCQAPGDCGKEWPRLAAGDVADFYRNHQHAGLPQVNGGARA